METIKNYLETMFANIPDNEETRKAKQELFSMMEDKYNELKDSGMAENEIVGTIITEFGNIDELKESLGLSKEPEPIPTFTEPVRTTAVVEEPRYVNTSKRLITVQEADEYVMDYTISRFLLGLGVFLCIISPVGTILGGNILGRFGHNPLTNLIQGIGVTFLFLAVGIGVGMIILSSTKTKQWKFLKRKTCALDYDTAAHVKNELEANHSSQSFMLALGILCCIISPVPVSALGIIGISPFLTGSLGPSLVLILTGVGVFFILNSTRRVSAYKKLLSLNGRS